MNNRITRLASLLAIIFFLASCTKNEFVEPQGITETEAIEIVENAFSEDLHGITAQVKDMSSVISITTSPYQVLKNCGATMDTSIILNKSTLRSSVTYQAVVDWRMDCHWGIPQTVELESLGTGVYETPNWLSNGRTVYKATVVGLEPNTTMYTYNGSFQRTSQLNKLDSKIGMNATIKATTNDLLVNKRDNSISQGTTTVSLEGVTDNGKRFSYNGIVTYLGNGSATVSLASGSNYTIQIK